MIEGLVRRPLMPHQAVRLRRLSSVVREPGVPRWKMVLNRLPASRLSLRAIRLGGAGNEPGAGLVARSLALPLLYSAVADRRDHLPCCLVIICIRWSRISWTCLAS